MNSSPSKPANNHQRQNVISWPDYFMATAFLAAKRSKDPATQVGACIVNPENRVVGIGYNGFPHGCSDSEFPWAKDTPNPLDSKYMYVVHAEVNAILNKNCADVNGCTIYVALFPCNECAKVIIQSRIKEVVYMSDKHADKASTVASKRLFDSAGVKCTQFYPTQNSIVIDFSEIEWSNLNQVPATPKKSDK